MIWFLYQVAMQTKRIAVYVANSTRLPYLDVRVTCIPIDSSREGWFCLRFASITTCTIAPVISPRPLYVLPCPMSYLYLPSRFLSSRGVGSILSLIRRPSGRKTKPEWPRGVGFLIRVSGELCKLPQRVRAEPGRQTILRQFQVTKAGLLVIPFHEFVGNN